MDFVKKACWLLLVFVGAVHVLPAEAVRDRYVEAQLVSDLSGLIPGEKNLVGLRLDHDAGWHTYWINPGDAGLETTIDWVLPEGYEAGEIIWPVPKKLPLSGLLNYGYEDEVFLLTEITVPADAPIGESATLRAKVDWLMCTDVCIPGGATLSLTLPVVNKADKTSWSDAIAKTLGATPRATDAWTYAASINGDAITLKFTPQSGANEKPKDVYFFSLDLQIEPSAEQALTQTEDGAYVLELKKSVVAEELSSLKGVLYASNGWVEDDPTLVGMSVEVPYGEPIAVVAKSEPAISLPLALMLAIGGGFILNLMPCVFPVIGLKIMSFVKQSGESRSKIAVHGVVFTLGVLVSMWVLAAIVLVFRAGGAELGWGFQLQNPVFNIVLTIFLLIFALNLAGLFEIGGSAVGIGQKLTSKSGLAGTFFMGALAVVVGTPCTAPLLGSILPFAMSAPPTVAVLFFTAIGIGLALPYILLALFPQLVYKLPRPGAWMESFKQAMAFLLFGTVAYFVYILGGQLDEGTYLNFLLALVGVSVACWIYGRWGAVSRSTRSRVIAKTTATILLASMVFISFPRKSEITWETWSPSRVAELEKNGQAYFIDFTARWCASCQSNKRIVFGSDEVKNLLLSKNIVLLKADWTQQDATITQGLREYGRSGVPLNVLHSPKLDEPIILPEVMLTAEPAIEAFKKI